MKNKDKNKKVCINCFFKIKRKNNCNNTVYYECCHNENAISIECGNTECAELKKNELKTKTCKQFEKFKFYKLFLPRYLSQQCY